MSDEQFGDTRRARGGPNLVVVVAGALVASLGLVALVGWFAGLPVLSSLHPDLMPMPPSTALLLVPCGVSLALLARPVLSTAARRAVAAMTVTGMAVALVLLVFRGLGHHAEFEHLGIDVSGEGVGGSPPGLMSPVTAACFLLAGVSVLATLRRRPGREWLVLPAVACAGAVVAISLLLLLPLLYAGPLLDGGTFTPPAAATTLAFTALGVGLVTLAVRVPDLSDYSERETRLYGYLLLVFLLLAAGLGALGHRSFVRHERDHHAEVARRLESVADLKVSELTRWRRERIADAEVLANNRSFQSLATRALGRDRGAMDEVRDWLAQVRSANGHDRVMLLDPEGRSRLSVPDGRGGDHAVPEDVFGALSSGRVAFEDFHRDGPGGPIRLSVWAPILDGGNHLAGMVGLEVDPAADLCPLIQRWPSPSRTAETLLARREGDHVLFLNELRFRRGTALALRLPLSDDRIPAVKAALGQTGVVEGTDYRGEPVVAALRTVPDSPWFLVARMDISEINEPLRARLWEEVSLLMALLAVAGISLCLVWRDRVGRFRRERLEATLALRQGEEALAASEERLRRTLDAMTEGFQILDRDWRYVYLNEAAAAQGRRRREDLLGRTIFECYPGIENTKQFDVMRACMEDRTPRFVEEEFAFPDGERAWFALGVHPAPEGISVVSLDISERKRSEARVAHLNSVLRGIRNVNQLITKEKDASRLLEHACERLTETMGYRKVWIATRRDGGLSLRGHAGGEAGAFDLLATEMARGFVPECASRASGQKGVVALRRGRDDCRGCPISAATPGCDILASRLEHDGVVQGVLVAGVPAGRGDDPEGRDLFEALAGDISFALYRIDLERRHAEVEEQLRMAQRLEAVGRLAGGVAHDFNNLTNIVLSYSGFVMDTLPPDDPRREDLLEVRKAADRAAALTRQLLAFSRKQVLKVEVLDLNQVVRGVEKMLRRLIGEDIDFRVMLAPDLGLVAADPGQIEQVLMNLVVNARDAMPAGGHLTIETANVDLGEDYVAHHLSSRPGPHVLLSVSDTGCGMDEETKSRIFEPFFTTKGLGKGTGLGLATVYGIVKQSGGNIWVYSEPGKGTTFKVYFPRVEGTGRPTPARPVSAVRPAGGKETILVAEDEEAVRRAASRVLRAAGYAVLEARDGREAIEVSERHGGPIHLVLTDVVMPGMGGPELVERLRAIHPGIRVIYSSGYTDDAIQHHGVLDPGVNFIGKPFESNAISRLVREVLDREGEEAGDFAGSDPPDRFRDRR